jgi:hypothetical protein
MGTMKTPRAIIILWALSIIVASAASATAGSLITGRQIANGTIGSIDIANGTLTGLDLRNGTVGAVDLGAGVVKPRSIAAETKADIVNAVPPEINASAVIDGPNAIAVPGTASNVSSVTRPSQGIYCIGVVGIDVQTATPFVAYDATRSLPKATIDLNPYEAQLEGSYPPGTMGVRKNGGEVAAAVNTPACPGAVEVQTRRNIVGTMVLDNSVAFNFAVL